MRVRVKICGITEPESLAAAVEAGADAVGFVMATSERRIEPKLAAELARDLPPFMTTVAVFRYPTVPELQSMAARFDPRPADAARRDCTPRECHERRIAFRRAWLADLADEVPHGTLTVVNYTGHFIQNEDPDLVASTIRRVVEAERPRREVALPRALLEGLVGTYEAASNTRLTVLLEGDQLFARLANQGGTPMFAASESLLFFRVVDAEISIERDAAGDVTRLVLEQNGRTTLFDRVR